MTIKTPMARALGLGSAKSGTEHWWMQRVSAVALVPLTLWFVIALLGLEGLDHATVTGWIATPVTAVLLLLLVATLTYHSFLGTQVVIEDYTGGATRVITLLAVRFLHVVVAVAALFAILKIAFGTET
ncbi:succinate dehydrogenase, hydrophobic membrane anchor protein [Lentisalinibacter sediminis]|uniref:succinate dehydrogenase, hydrophobic membrane anchor protein n=1 Tax=Lentisalinibacter sediminis TaxID=2992237 RepID=UPI0038708A09